MAKADKRYTITLEFCGRATAMYVVRFCREWVGEAPTKPAAQKLMRADQLKRATGLGQN